MQHYSISASARPLVWSAINVSGLKIKCLSLEEFLKSLSLDFRSFIVDDFDAIEFKNSTRYVDEIRCGPRWGVDL